MGNWHLEPRTEGGRGGLEKGLQGPPSPQTHFFRSEALNPFVRETGHVFKRETGPCVFVPAPQQDQAHPLCPLTANGMVPNMMLTSHSTACLGSPLAALGGGGAPSLSPQFVCASPSPPPPPCYPPVPTPLPHPHPVAHSLPYHCLSPSLAPSVFSSAFASATALPLLYPSTCSP